jgi:hypothetical protein
MEGSCFIYVLCVYLHMMASRTYCVVVFVLFVFVLLSIVANFSGLFNFWLPLRCSLTFIYNKYMIKTKQFLHDGCHYWSRNCLLLEWTKVHLRSSWVRVVLYPLVIVLSVFFLWSMYCLSFSFGHCIVCLLPLVIVLSVFFLWSLYCLSCL